ncbi:hypothetical protein CHARACLAT_019711, partial [Characodon lateralis]|nr:hypothetical protein [Characodon lateralis]
YGCVNVINESKSLFSARIILYVRLKRSTSCRDVISLSFSSQTSDLVWSRGEIVENGRLKIRSSQYKKSLRAFAGDTELQKCHYKLLQEPKKVLHLSNKCQAELPSGVCDIVQTWYLLTLAHFRWVQLSRGSACSSVAAAVLKMRTMKKKSNLL